MTSDLAGCSSKDARNVGTGALEGFPNSNRNKRDDAARLSDIRFAGLKNQSGKSPALLSL